MNWDYVILGVTVFLFLMFVGVNARLGTVEIIVANQLQEFEKYREAGKVQVEFNKGVIEYHNEMDRWLAKVEGRLKNVESTG